MTTQVGKLKILWLCHYSLVHLKDKLDIDLSGYKVHSAPWMKQLAKGVVDTGEVELHIITVSHAIKTDIQLRDSSISFEIFSTHNQITFKGIAAKLLRFWSRRALKKKIKQRINEIGPDIITLHGTEHIFSSIITDVSYPVVVWMAGMMRAVFRSDESRVARNLISRETKLFQDARHFITAQPHIIAEIKTENQDAQYYPLFYPVNPVAFNDRAGYPQDSLTLCFTGAVVEKKGLLELIEAYSQVQKEFAEVRLEIIGSSEPHFLKRLKKIIEDKELEHKVLIHGHIRDHDEVVRRMSACDIFVYPTHADTAPLSLAEAMAAGRAIVSTNVDGIPAMLDGGRCGLMVPLRDPDALAGAIIQLIRDKAMREELGANARQFAEKHFELSRVSSDYLKLCYSLASGSK